MTIEALVLDADGVVIFPWRFATYLTQEHGITREMTAPFFTGVFDDCLLGGAELKEVLPPFLDDWGWGGSVDEFVTTWLETEDAADGRVLEVVRRARRRGVVCCLASSQERIRAGYLRTEMGLGRLFDRLFFSCELGCQKPDGAFYASIERALELAGDRIWFWDDSAANVEAARAQGWQAEVYAGFEGFERRVRKRGI